MSGQDYHAGVICRGGPSSVRKVCGWRAAFARHLEGGARTSEGYLSLFTYPAEAFMQHVKRNGFAGYRGPVSAEFIAVDFDNADDPAAAIEGARALLRWLEATAAADLRRVLACFSGGKGAHVYLPAAGLLIEPSPALPKVAKAFALLLAQGAGARYLDGSIYDAARIFRLPNTRHAKTGLLKVPFDGADFVGLSASEIIEHGRGEPQGVEFPFDDGPSDWCNWELRDYWQRAAAYVEQQAGEIPPACEKTALNRSTLDFLAAIPEAGHRHNALFQAAANLGEFGADERLARALLYEQARDSGLPPSEIDSTIQAGVRHGRGVAL